MEVQTIDPLTETVKQELIGVLNLLERGEDARTVTNLLIIILNEYLQKKPK